MTILEFNIRAYLEFIGVPFWGTGKNVSEGWIGIQCTYCDDTSNHLGINLIYKNWTCWKCKAHGNIADLIQNLENCNYQEAIERIEEFQSPELVVVPERKRLDDHGQDILPNGCTRELTPRMKSYLRNRRFNPDTLMQDWNLRAGPFTGKWKYRVIVPITHNGKVLTWIGMDTTGRGTNKYLSATMEESIVPSSELIYGGDCIDRHVLIVEGITDVWRIGYGTVAVLGIGAAHMDAKIKRLVELNVRRYYIMFDAEDKAQENANSLGTTLKMVSGKPVQILELLQGDPDDLSNQEAKNLRRELKL